MPVELSNPEDVKIVTLAKATRLRTGSAQGAAVRDLDGRTYAAAPVDLVSLQLSALQLAVAMAVSSGARGLEAAAVSTDSDVAEADLAAVRDLGGPGVDVIAADARGAATAVLHT
ncbi:cytidine/deoxycytidylate deaminase family protein [Solicola gregarius]|uniref:Cytidine deaminase n=1 Tax=Solicola gregarius TaxID=2908642 RepID=A0AA46TI85_9ACTN|nr:cytidine deaminase [Solicola gregarius]UYM05740.1 cytidine deaminase [Solicola gregarius]